MSLSLMNKVETTEKENIEKVEKDKSEKEEGNIDLQEGRRRRLERKGGKELRSGQSMCRAHAPGKSLSILM